MLVLIYTGAYANLHETRPSNMFADHRSNQVIVYATVAMAATEIKTSNKEKRIRYEQDKFLVSIRDL